MRDNRTRNKHNRKTYKTILIGREGSRKNNTEHAFFESFNKRNVGYRIIDVPGNCTDPENMVEEAIKAVAINGLDLNNGDHCFVLIDTDTKAEKNEQIQKAKNLADNNGIELIISSPLFELWFLQYFEKTSHECDNKEILRRLKNYIPNYKKGESIVDELVNGTQDPIVNAKSINKSKQALYNSGKFVQCNPYTDVYKIIETLNTIKKSANS